MHHWAFDSVFYHLYPLGFCGAPERNDFRSPPVARLEKLCGWLDHLQAMGVGALYLGPLFESSAHGYDTADYFRVDRRLGDNGTLATLSAELHRRGLRLVLDGVFHHVGRDFWAFRDLRDHGEASAYRSWFAGLTFDRRSPHGDAFAYDGWEGNFDLVKLDLGDPSVREHLFEAVRMWIREFGIDGLRLDVAYLLDEGFLGELGRVCRALDPDFWLLGEVIHGDYRRWTAPGLLDSVTNYECYKGLYSSHNDRNYFEIAYALNRQFGEAGMYRHLPLYNFADNHDVHRVASSLHDSAHLYPLYCLLFTMPGVPSIYYGSEWGVEGRRGAHDDRQLRPALELERAARDAPHPKLAEAIARLARLRVAVPALRTGSYRQLHVGHEQLAFLRRNEAGPPAIVGVNAAGESAALELPAGAAPADTGRGAGQAAAGQGVWQDLLNPPDKFTVSQGKLTVALPPRWARVLVPA